MPTIAVPTPQNLGPIAEQLLGAFVTHLTDLGITVPDRRYVAPGQLVAWDNDQLVVNLQAISQGQPGRPYEGTYAAPAAINLYAEFVISLVRSVPGLYGEGPTGAMIPDAAGIDAAGQMLIQDASALVQAATLIYSGYELTDPGEGFAIGQLLPVGPEGGLAANRLPITISLS